ncbi:MAG: glycogen/starch/alpha-glucan phosphorylase [Cyanobacteriota bacterium]
MTSTLRPAQDIPSPASYGDPERTGLTAANLRDGVTEHLFFSLGRSAANATPHDLYMALSHAVRDRLMSRHLAYKEVLRSQRPKAVAYLSAEFLIGPQLGNNLLMLGIRAEAEEAMRHFGIASLEPLLAIEEEPGLGNGGLGRLAACYIESLATLEIPATGYGIRYEFGIFDQAIRNGWQVEITDQWLKGGWPWELVLPDKRCRVGFGGHTEAYRDSLGRYRVRWIPAEHALGIPHDVPMVGYRVNTCARLRLWRAAACEGLDLAAFNSGDFYGAVEEKVSSENLSKVLYPNDGTEAGRRLRLKQQFFFVSCSLQDMLRNLQKRNVPLQEFADHWAVQLNDTHPAIAVAELMRLLLDEHLFGWGEAWAITQRSIAYTNHTLLPEALECWSLGLFAAVLPRHLEIIFEINRRFLQQVRLSAPGDEELLRRVSIIDERGGKAVRMAHLATVAAHHVNGVAELHSGLVRTALMPEFAALWPGKFTNVTNGVTPRRWMALASPPLNDLLSEAIGPDWPVQAERWSELERFAHDSAFLERWGACRLEAKRRLAQRIASDSQLVVDPLQLFDVQVKRIHEYKRQHLNALQVITRYLRIKNGESAGMAPRTVLFGGKAAPGYFMAKLIIRFIHGIAEVVNSDPDCRGLLQVVFLPDYNVKLSELVYPAADLSQQISTAGYEASGTGNMKLAMNGALTIGTLDGANVEIRQRVGEENFFLFGHTAEQIAALLPTYRPWEWLEGLPLLREAINLVEGGHFSQGDPQLFRPLVENIVGRDPFALIADFASYLQAQAAVDSSWAAGQDWRRRSLLTVARSGFFSSDRAIRSYAEQIWTVSPCPVDMTCPLPA